MTDMRSSGSGAAVEISPHLDDIEPAFGSEDGHERVSLTGYALSDVVQIQFGEEFATQVHVEDQDTVSCLTPPNLPGRVQVTAITRTNRESNALEFDYR